MRKYLLALGALFFSVGSYSATPSDLLDYGYSLYQADYNGDGCIDYLLRAPARVMVLDLDDLIIPLVLNNKSIILMSGLNCAYSSVDDVASDMLNDSRWVPAEYRLVIGDSRGDGGGSIIAVPIASTSLPLFNIVRDPISKGFLLLQTLRPQDLQIATNDAVVSLEYSDADLRSDLVVRRGAQILAIFSAGADGSFSIASDENLVAMSHFVWKSFLDSLTSGNLGGALASVSNDTKDLIQTLLNVAGGNLSTLAESITRFGIIEVKSNYVRAAVVVAAGGQEKMYFVVFGRDSDGAWKIYSM